MGSKQVVQPRLANASMRHTYTLWPPSEFRGGRASPAWKSNSRRLDKALVKPVQRRLCQVDMGPSACSQSLAVPPPRALSGAREEDGRQRILQGPKRARPETVSFKPSPRRLLPKNQPQILQGPQSSQLGTYVAGSSTSGPTACDPECPPGPAAWIGTPEALDRR